MPDPTLLQPGWMERPRPSAGTRPEGNNGHGAQRLDLEGIAPPESYTRVQRGQFQRGVWAALGAWRLRAPAPANPYWQTTAKVAWAAGRQAVREAAIVQGVWP